MTSFAAEYEARCNAWSDIHAHLPRIYTETVAYTEPQIVELGVRSGNSTATFLAAVEKVGGHLWSVDPAVPAVPAEWHQSEMWTFIHGDDLIVDGRIPDGVDVLFIDTTHAYRQTAAEIAVYVPKVRSGGVILFHDTELAHPESEPDCEPFPVMRAIEDAGLICEYVAGCNGLGVVRR
jgi:hypothetical protein